MDQICYSKRSVSNKCYSTMQHILYSEQNERLHLCRLKCSENKNSDHKRPATKLKCMGRNSKYKSNKTRIITNCSGICNTMCHNGIYLLLFGKQKWQRFKIPYE